MATPVTTARQPPPVAMTRAAIQLIGHCALSAPRPSLDVFMSFGGWVDDMLGPATIQRGDDAGYRVASDGLGEGAGPAQAMGSWDHGLHGAEEVRAKTPSRSLDSSGLQ